MTGEKNYIIYDGNLRQVVYRSDQALTIINQGKLIEVPLSKCELISLTEFFNQ